MVGMGFGQTLTGYSDLNEGDIVPVPCGHCASISIYVELHTRVAAAPCCKCGGTSNVAVERHPAGWTIKSLRADPEA